ncbi:MAG: septum formation initiator family protein [Burkholderiaceae bacterium]
MRKRLVPLGLIALLAIVHAQLWIGRGSIPSVTAMTQQLAEQKEKNELARQSNQRLEAEVRDLKEGMEMVEEKARFELGMVRPNEILVQIGK